MPTLLELNYQRRKAWAEANGLLDAAMAETRALTIPEQVRFDALAVRINEIDAAYSERESLRKLVS
jgi:hypothetical protein